MCQENNLVIAELVGEQIGEPLSMRPVETRNDVVQNYKLVPLIERFYGGQEECQTKTINVTFAQVSLWWCFRLVKEAIFDRYTDQITIFVL